MQNIVILTGSELRHHFFRKALSATKGISVLCSYIEGLEGSIKEITESKKKQSAQELLHLKAREQSEKDFFLLAEQFIEDTSHPKAIVRGSLNDSENVEEIISLNPDIIVSYGCSIIKEPLLSEFNNRIINIHLGLSPYYRGCGTNFWPLVNNEPEYIGVTFMYIDSGIDTGEIIHQIRPRIYEFDGPHQIGNRLISDMIEECEKLLESFDSLDNMTQPSEPENVKVYRNKDFSEEATCKLYSNFADGMIQRYLLEKGTRCKKAPIIENPAVNNAC